MMKEDAIKQTVAHCVDETKSGLARIPVSDFRQAREACERGDAKALFVLYEKAVENLGYALATIEMLSELKPGASSAPDPSSPYAINAIREVALGAIELARGVIKSQEKEPSV